MRPETGISYAEALGLMERVGQAMADELRLELRKERNNIVLWSSPPCDDHREYVEVRMTRLIDNEVLLRVLSHKGTASLQLKADKRHGLFQLDLLGCHREVGRPWMERMYEIYSRKMEEMRQHELGKAN